MRHRVPSVIVALALVYLSSCGAGGTGGPRGSDPAISISPTTVSLFCRQTQQFAATLVGLSNPAVVWTVNGAIGGSSAAGTITGSGLYTAPCGGFADNSQVTVTVASVEDSTLSASATVTLKALTLTITPKSVNLQPGQSQQFTVTANDGNPNTVNWFIDGIAGGNATVGTITSTGLYTAPATVPTPNMVSVKGFSTVVPTVVCHATVTIAAVTVSVLPGMVSLVLGQSQQFTASVTGTSNTAVSWSVNGVAGGNSTVGTVSPSGLYTAPAALPSPNTVAVTATSAADTSATGSATVTLLNPVPTLANLSPASVGAGVAAFNLTVNGTGFVPGSVVQFNGTSLSTTFISGVQLLALVPASAVATAGSAMVTVVNPPPGGGTSNALPFTFGLLVSVVVSPPAVTLGLGQAAQFTATVTGTTNTAVTWSVNNVAGGNAALGTIDSSGLYTAPAAIPSAATVTVMARSVAQPSAVGSAMVTLVNPGPTITLLSPASVTSGSASFTLMVDGAGFIPTSVVHFNGSSLLTSFVSSVQLTAVVPATDVASAGTASITVINPPPGGGTSNAATFTISSPVVPAGVIALISLDSSGNQGNDGSIFASTNVNGRFIAFTSFATNLVAGDTNGVSDIFVRDNCTGVATGCSKSTLRASLDSSGNQGDGPSDDASISDSGRFVAFESGATNLVSGDTNGVFDVFVRDTCVGGPLSCVLSTTRASVDTSGVQGNSTSGVPSISGNGRFVAFQSDATNLVAGDTNGVKDIFVRDTCAGVPTGCTPSTARVSLSDTGAQGDNMSFETIFSSLPPSRYISDDGRFVAFLSMATNLVTAFTPSSFGDLYVRDTCVGAGVGCTPTTHVVSVNTGGIEGNSAPEFPSISADGRFIAFDSPASNLVSSVTVTGAGDIYVRDTCAGAPIGCTPSTIIASLDNTGAPSNDTSFSPSISGNGRFVAFISFATNLAPPTDVGLLNGGGDIYIRDTCLGAPLGCVPSTVLASINSSAVPGNGASLNPSISGDGHFVAFQSFADNLVPVDTNGFVDIFLGGTSF